MDPLTVFPVEIVLRILDFADVPSIANLTRLNKPWHHFIDFVHQDTIYSSPSKTNHPPGAQDFSFLTETTSFSRYFDGVASWKALCKQQFLLANNWNARQPETRESVIQVGNDAIWRFRADFKRRWILSTSQQGGMNVTDMDTGETLWRLSKEQVRPFAHLEYDDGMAVWDRESDSLEVWKCDGEGLERGEFRRVAILPHDCQTRGFQLSYGTLCVVSTEGQGFVYDMTVVPPRLQTHLSIEHEAVGHVDQEEDIVMYSMGKKGYHIHDKTSGDLLGVLHPKHCKSFYHAAHPSQAPNTDLRSETAFNALPSTKVFPPSRPSKDRLCTIDTHEGHLPRTQNSTLAPLDDDEWGAGMLSGSLMVGISRHGRVFICRDWRAALRDNEQFAAHTSILECESDGSKFDLGGWLSVRNSRIMFEIQDLIYIVTLDGNCSITTSDSLHSVPTYTFPTSSAAQLAVPVSFMALFDDCVMTTYTTLGWRQNVRNDPAEEQAARMRIFPTKIVRVVSFAPATSEDETASAAESANTPSDMYAGGPQASLLRFIDMLSAAEELDDEYDGEQVAGSDDE